MTASDAMENVSGVQFDPFFGVVARALGWVPSLRYLLRRQRVLNLFGGIHPGALVEVGCGAGALLVDFARRGFACRGLETSPQAAEIAERLAAANGFAYSIQPAARADWNSAFDVVCAFDVLEHIRDDKAALREWFMWLKPGGELVLSVPAHQRRWGPGDVWAGHYRRYDRADLLQLLAEQGFNVTHIECYGFPLANLTEWAGRRTYRRLLNARVAESEPEAASAESGVQRQAYLRKFHWMESLPGRLALRISYALQYLFRRRNVGSGYLVQATRQ